MFQERYDAEQAGEKYLGTVMKRMSRSNQRKKR